MAAGDSGSACCLTSVAAAGKLVSGWHTPRMAGGFREKVLPALIDLSVVFRNRLQPDVARRTPLAPAEVTPGRWSGLHSLPFPGN